MGSTTYGYDANGNMTGRAGDTLSYDAENRLTQVTSGGTTTTYAYDGDGNRVKRSVTSGGTTTTTYYVGNYFEVTGSTVTKYYYLGAQRVAMNQNGTVYYLHGDHLGSTNVVSGAAISKQTYYPFGMPRTTEGTLPTDYAFTGQRQDIYIKLIEMGSRWYDPELGRWTQPDSIIPNVYNPQSLNRFSYVLNNPLRYTDPTGHYNECGDDCSDEDKALSDNVPAIEIIEDTIRENLNQDFGVNTNKAFSVGQLRILETMLYDFANKAGSVNAARRAIHGVVFHNNAPGKGEYGTEQFGGLISLDNWVWQSDTAAAKRTLLHELAHYWDWAASDPLTQFFNLGIISFQMRIQVNEIGPTEYARSGPPRENWAESVEMFVYPDYASVLRGADSEKHNGVYVEPGLRPQTRDFVNSKFTELRRGLR